ncbi:methylenetetrahydrofolate reductase (NADPH)-like [Onthophagus taurus]|uniref:methylenetetrahydrofolate reductase (NADPH)-like n=1 Tax=Onthophagus taurus TaxID=166361 RepID=UPI0039BDEFB9
MSKITAVLKQLKPNLKSVSFELIHNKKVLNLEEITKLSPLFCSVTWLDNNLKDLESHPSVSLAKELIKNDLNVILHLPGKIFDRETAIKLLNLAQSIGIRNILALQGEYSLWKDVAKDDFPFAKDLVEFIKENYKDYFCVGITGYPSGHHRVATLELDTKYLKEKSLKADFIITQAVFDVASLKSFYKRCEDNDINLPIIPGIFIINSHDSLMHMIKLCKLTLPEQVKDFLENNKNNKEVIKNYGIESAINVIGGLLSDEEVSIKCVHIFTMNNFENVKEVLKIVKPAG